MCVCVCAGKDEDGNDIPPCPKRLTAETEKIVKDIRIYKTRFTGKCRQAKYKEKQDKD
jgi:hypothetical protein